MQSSAESRPKRQNRSKAVLPVKVRGKDVAGKHFEDLAHTLDVTRSGAKLGSIRRQLNVPEQLTIVYRQRKMEFRVVWVKQLKGSTEFQVGLQAVAEEGESWGLNFSEHRASQVNMPAKMAQADLGASPVAVSSAAVSTTSVSATVVA